MSVLHRFTAFYSFYLKFTIIAMSFSMSTNLLYILAILKSVIRITPKIFVLISSLQFEKSSFINLLRRQGFFSVGMNVKEEKIQKEVKKVRVGQAFKQREARYYRKIGNKEISRSNLRRQSKKIR